MPQSPLSRVLWVAALAPILALLFVLRPARHATPDQTDAIPLLAPPPPAPPAPQTRIADNPDSGNHIELERRCLRTAETDPLAAMEFAQKNNLTDDDPGLLTNLMMQWASQDFDGAYAWTKAQNSDAWRDNILAHLAYLRAQTDPIAAARLTVSDITPGPARDEAMISVLHQWALRDVGSAKAWVDSFQDEKLRKRALDEIRGIQSQGRSRLRH